MESKRFLQDVPNEVLLAKFRRANGMMTQEISEEILFRSIFPESVKQLKFDENGKPIELTKKDEQAVNWLKNKGINK